MIKNKTPNQMSIMEWQRYFNKRIITLLESRGMSQYQLSILSGIPRSRLSDYINMKAMPTIFAIINIAHVFEVSIESLIDFGKRIEVREV